MTHFLLALIGYLSIGVGYTFGFLVKSPKFKEEKVKFMFFFRANFPEAASKLDEMTVEETEYLLETSMIVSAIVAWPLVLLDLW